MERTPGTQRATTARQTMAFWLKPTHAFHPHDLYDLNAQWLYGLFCKV